MSADEKGNFQLQELPFLIKPPEFDVSKQVRVLLFRELNGQERRLLFDSKAVSKRDPASSPVGKPPPGVQRRRPHESSIEKSFKLSDHQSKEYVYEWQKSSSDETLLREMIFGSVSISYQGTTLKVHTMRSPTQIMLSLVFPAPPPPPTSRTEEPETEESGNWTSSIEVKIKSPEKSSDIHLAHSVPVNVPSRLSGQFNESRDSDSDSLQSHDGYNSLPSTHLTPESPRSGIPRSSSYNSLQRRILRNKATSIELGLSKAVEAGTEYSRTSGQKRSKLGLSVVINLGAENDSDKHFIDFLFTHIALIESHILSLKDTVIKAYLNRKNFVHFMFEGSKRFQERLNDLYTTPRLHNPEWLTIISSPNHRHLSYSFLDRFAHVLKHYDKKETNFFVSTLLTAVLTHHLSWVPSVIPTDSKIQSTQSSHKHTPFWVDLLAKSRPYNPLWVQLSDLYGALGNPPRLTKTVVKGQRKELVSKFLKILSYFIRCSDICQRKYEKIDMETENLDIRKNVNNIDDKSTCTGGSSSSKRLSSTGSHCSTPVTSVTETCLPQTLYCPTNTPHLPDTICASSSSKNIFELITQTSISHQSIKTESESVPMPSENIAKSSELDSLGYMSLEEKVDEVNSSLSKRVALREHPTNCILGKSSVTSQNSVKKNGKENEPIINVTLVEEANQKTGCYCESKCNEQESDTKYCPCYDNPPSDLTPPKDILFGSPKGKECESIEDGYHSMEEPHSPSREKGLGEILKRFENWYPEGCKETPLPGLHSLQECSDPSPYKSFGWSLMTGVSDRYLLDFCLQGVSGPLSEEEIRDDLIRSTYINILGEPVSESLCLIADTDKWSVNLLSSHYVGGDRAGAIGSNVTMSSLVSGLCDALMSMIELGISPESCIIYLEDRLQELYTRSQTLVDYVRGCKGFVPQSKIASALGIDISDLPLLTSIASTHSPDLPIR